MKTKHILTAMVLPTLLAACTADEIVENNNNIVALGRANVEAVSFAANGADSRLAYNEDELKWDWENTDKFLLLNADDGQTLNTAEGTFLGARFKPGAPTTGYEYAQGEDGTYETEASVMGEGLYWGYAPSFNKVGRGYVEYALPASQKLNDYQDVASQVLITPLYEVSAAAYNNKLPLDMLNWYSTVILPFTNSTENDITIKQIVLKAADAAAFNVKGLIDTSVMGDFIMAWDAENEEWVPALNCDDKEANDFEDKEDMLDTMRKTSLTKTVTGGTSNALVLDAEETVIPAGETKIFHMLAPFAEDITCEITVIAKEGVVEIDQYNKSNALVETNIYHNGRKAAFGWTSEGEAKAYNIKAFEKLGDSYYVTSYSDMMKYINTVNGTFSVYNLGDWAIDAKMANAIERSDAYVIFNNNIAIEGEVELTKVEFGQNAVVTVLEDAVVEFASVGKNNNNACVYNLVVEAGAEVTLTDGCFRSIANYGVLNVTSGAAFESSEIVTNGTLNLIENNGGSSIVLKGGTLNYKQDAKNNGWSNADNSNLTFDLTANAEIVVDEYVSLRHGVANNAEWSKTIGDDTYTVSVTNNGDISMEGGVNGGDMTVTGTLVNNGNITSESNTLTLYGTSTNARNALIQTLVFTNAEGAALTNDGYLIASENENSSYVNTNNGVIIAGAKSKTVIEAGEGRIDNSAEAKLVLGDNYSGQTVFMEFDDVDVATLAMIEYELYNVNTIRVKGTLDLNKNFSDYKEMPTDENNVPQVMLVRRLELADGASVQVAKNKTIVANFDKIVLEGNAKVEGWSKNTSVLELQANVQVEVRRKATTGTTGYKITGETVTVKMKDNCTVSVIVENEETEGNEVNRNATVKLIDASLFNWNNGQAFEPANVNASAAGTSTL